MKASKVGGEWRIRREDVELLIGGTLEKIKEEMTDDIRAFVNSQDHELTGKVQVCAIVDCYMDLPEAALISQTVMWHMNESNPNRGQAKIQYLYDEKANRGRYIIWGSPAFIGALLSAIGQVAKD